jgi:hypothetical protein
LTKISTKYKILYTKYYDVMGCKLKQMFFAYGAVGKEVGELEQTVDADKQALQNIPIVPHTTKSALSPLLHGFWRKPRSKH